ncbi:MAG: hypothetical protein NTZ42_03855 [Candidatus Gribaldobacteria bacterium]|nr:hypothetical protein [Candidatus Gribaldobacteria bacterium]
MAKHQIKDNITLSKATILRQKGMVILSLREYKRLCENAVPIHHLEGKEAQELDWLIRDGVAEYKAGKCKTIKSLADLD